MNKIFRNGILIFCFMIAMPVWAEQNFSSPAQALQALKSALMSADVSASLSTLFGAENSDLWNSGDKIQDQHAKEKFLQRLSEKKKWVAVDATHQILYVGNDSWSFPIPLVKKEKRWSFDIKIGREEILNRRIGANELDAIASARDYVRAQKEYAAKSSGAYAKQFLSDSGKKNGLYWVSDNPQDSSPIGPRVLQAKAEGYKASQEDPTTVLYHGYYYHILKAKKGFALVAYPAKWNDSGVMTFLVDQDGQILQKNLGQETATLVAQIKSYNPDSTWKAVK